MTMRGADEKIQSYSNESFILILCLGGAFGVIYDLFYLEQIYRPGVVIQYFFISGIVSLVVSIVTYFIDKKLLKSRK